MPWNNLPPGNDKYTNITIRKIKLKVQHYPKDSMKNPVMPINKFSMFPDIKPVQTNQLYFYITNKVKSQKRKFEKMIPFTIT